MTQETPKPRKPAGPKITVVNRRLVNVGLGQEHVDRAREIGRGNLSAGVRIAVEAYKEENAKK